MVKSIKCIFAILFVLSLSGCKHYKIESGMYEQQYQIQNGTAFTYSFNDIKNYIVYQKHDLTQYFFFTTDCDVSRQTLVDNILYLHGPGGLFAFDYKEEDFNVIDRRNVSTVGHINDKVYYIVNSGNSSILVYDGLEIEFPYLVSECVSLNDEQLMIAYDARAEREYGHLIYNFDDSSYQKVVKDHEGRLVKNCNNIYYVTDTYIEDLTLNQKIIYDCRLNDLITMYDLISVEPLIFLVQPWDGPYYKRAFLLNEDTNEMIEFKDIYTIYYSSNHLYAVDEAYNIKQYRNGELVNIGVNCPKGSFFCKAFYMNG